MNERNVCIGDIISVGSEVILQVALPRTPCYKLNHRFSLKHFAPKTSSTSRTGWYYRVLQEGSVSAGDELRLVDRKWPKWTIERVQEYLHRNLEDHEMNRELSEVEALGEESRGQFTKRLEKERRRATKSKESNTWRNFKITGLSMAAPDVVHVKMEAETPDPEADGPRLGAHARLRLPSGLVRSYSIVSAGSGSQNAANGFELGIKREQQSRGGSKWFHDIAKVGDVIEVGTITAGIKPPSSPSAHHFIVGGIGITAFLALLETLHAVNYTYKVHYAIRSMDAVPFRDRLEKFEDQVEYYDASRGQRMDVKAVVSTMPWNSFLYVCGPARMMDAVKKAAEESGLSEDEVHYEAFGADATGDPFEAQIGGPDGKIVEVEGEDSLLETLRRSGFDMPSSCEVGNCGTCKVGVREGRVEHRGTALTSEEQKDAMLSCVSRGVGRIVIDVENCC